MDALGEPPPPGKLATIIFWLLLLVVAWAPLPFGSNRPWAWSLLSLCVGGLMLIWAIGAIFDSTLVQLPWGRYRPLFILFFLFIGWSIYQAMGPAPASWWAPAWQRMADALHTPVAGVISSTPEKSMTAIMRLLAYAGIFWLALQLGRRTRCAKAALWSVVVAAFGYAIYGLFVQFTDGATILWFKKWSYGGVVTATFVNRNHFAIYAGVGILCALALIADQTRQTTEASIATRSGFIQLLDNMSIQLVILVITFMILVTALLLTQSRAGAIVTVMGVIVFLIVLATTSAFAAKSVARFGLVILIAGGVFGVISGSLLASRIVNVIENLTERINVFKITLHAISDRPFLGFGLGSFASVFPGYRGTEFIPNAPTYDYAHNIYLELALESGLPGASLLLLAVALATGVCAWGARQRHRNGYFSALGVSVTVLLGAHGLVDFSLQIPAISAVYCLILGVAYSQAWPTESANADHITPAVVKMVL